MAETRIPMDDPWVGPGYDTRPVFARISTRACRHCGLRQEAIQINPMDGKHWKDAE